METQRTVSRRKQNARADAPGGTPWPPCISNILPMPPDCIWRHAPDADEQTLLCARLCCRCRCCHPPLLLW